MWQKEILAGDLVCVSARCAGHSAMEGQEGRLQSSWESAAHGAAAGCTSQRVVLCV